METKITYLSPVNYDTCRDGQQTFVRSMQIGLIIKNVEVYYPLIIIDIVKNKIEISCARGFIGNDHIFFEEEIPVDISQKAFRWAEKNKQEIERLGEKNIHAKAVEFLRIINWGYFAEIIKEKYSYDLLLDMQPVP